jgi:sugar lactone lactonase YvrE
MSAHPASRSVHRSPFVRSVVATALALGLVASATTSVHARPEPTLRVLAGGGDDPGDGIPATDARLSAVEGATARPDGTLVLADTYANRIRQVDRDGTITTIAGTGTIGSTGDGGPASQAELFFPFAVAVTPRGEVVVADTYNQRIRRIDRQGRITTIAGTGTAGSAGLDAPATEAQLRFPFGVDVAPNGEVLIADTFNHRVVTIDRSGRLQVVAGTGASGYSGDGGPAEDAQLRLPYTARWGQAGRIVIADTGNDRVRVVGRDGTIETIAGDGTRGFSGDGGPAVDAQLAAPHTVAVDATGRIVVGDTNNNRLREVRRDGTIVTIAGTGAATAAPDGTTAVDAPLRFRTGLMSPRPGVFVLAENGNQRVIEIR